MKYKNSVMVVAVALGLTVTLFAVETQSAKNSPAPVLLKANTKPSEKGAPTLIRLKSNGETIAELKIPKGTEYSIEAKEANLDQTSGRTIAKGGVSIKIRHAGASPVVVNADEVEAVY
jgi:hypothetical protein